MTTNTKRLSKLGISAVFVIIIAMLLTGAVNAGLGYYESNSKLVLRVQEEYAAKKSEVLTLIADALKEAEGESAQEALKYYEALALREKLIQEERFYQYYKTKKDYHYYGKYYELFNNVSNADTLILGSSRAVYGVNPKILEDEGVEGSFYNYAFNGARPSYFRSWYHVLKDEANYPIPKTVIYCVDWFMFDTGWMWRDIEGTDAAMGGALYEIRQFMKNNPPKNDDKNPVQTDITTEVTTEPDNIDGVVTTEPIDTEKGGKKYSSGFLGWLERLWDGDLNKIEEFGESLTEDLPLFAYRDKIPQMLSYVVSGQGKKDAEAAEEQRKLLQAELDEKYEEYERILSGEGMTEYPEVQIPSYDHTKSFVVDYDGNITSKYYKGWLPWEFDYAGNAGGNGPQFQERAPDNISYSADNIPAHILAEINAFRQFIKELKRDGVNVIFVQLPDYNGGGVASRNDEVIRAHTKVISDYAEKEGIPFIDYDRIDSADGESVANNKGYYSNWNHLNEKGSEALSKILAKDLKALLSE